VITAWRLASGRYSPLTGEGARLVGGRWNSPGRPLVYASESLALCLAECLVHLPARLPPDYIAFKVAIPEDSLGSIDVEMLSHQWEFDISITRAIGDEWLTGAKTVALTVPSAIVPESRNLLLDPSHPRFAEVHVLEQQPFRFDPRLRP
jgi:RES domain-containing protein